MKQEQKPSMQKNNSDKYLVVTEREVSGLNVMISSQATSDELRGVAACLLRHAERKEEATPTIH